MHIRTAHITVAASRDEVFHFLSRVSNLAEWATEFCERVEHREGYWVAHTSQGEMRVAIESDPPSGAIDIYAGADPTAMALFPVRVLSIPPGVTLVAFTFCQSLGLSDELYERQYASLLTELRGLARRFGGGVLQAPQPEVLPQPQPLAS